MRRVLAVASLSLLVGCSGGGIRTAARPPDTRVAAITETLQGVTITDNYRWLEGERRDPRGPATMTPEIAAWIDAQNHYTRTVLDGLPNRQAIENRLRPLMDTGTVTAPVVRGNRFFYAIRGSADRQLSVHWRDGSLGADRTLIDPASIDPSGLTAIAWFTPSYDGTTVAFGAVHAGDPAPALRVLDVDRGQILPWSIPGVARGVQWLPDGSGFLYERLASPPDAASIETILHELASPPDRDVVMYRGPAGTLSRDGRWLVITAPTGPASNDVWIADITEFRRLHKLVPRPVVTGAPGLTSGTVTAGVLLLQTTMGAANGRIVAADPGSPGAPHWRDLVAERKDAVIEGVAIGRGALVVTYRHNASSSIEVFDLGGQRRGTLRLPGIGVAAVTASEDQTDAYLTFTSFNTSTTVYRVNLAAPDAPPRQWLSADATVDPASVDVTQVWYPSKDGTQISMFLAYKRGFTPRGDAPVVIGAFGAFGANMTPAFSATQFPWFEAGGVIALPNLRGGGEYGEAWHAAAVRDRKPRTFEDLVAAAEWLIANKYTNPRRLAVLGSSHGALAASVAITQRPDLFRAAVLLVPLTDMVRFDRDPEGRAWTAEYGAPDDPAALKVLAAYSPYHAVKRGARYPAVLMTALEHDTAVSAWHARKMTAALQAASASDRGEQPILLRVDQETPHGPSELSAVQLRDLVDQRIFLMWQLGML